MLEKIEGKGRRGRQRTRWLGGITEAMEMNLSKLREIVEDGEAWRAVVCGATESETTPQLKSSSTAAWVVGVVSRQHLVLCFGGLRSGALSLLCEHLQVSVSPHQGGHVSSAFCLAGGQFPGLATGASAQAKHCCRGRSELRAS